MASNKSIPPQISLWETPPTNFSFILFERVNRAENAQRYYYLGWLPTLLHSRAVVRMYGRKGQTQHMITPQPFDSIEEAWPLIRRIIKTRLRHGYRVVQPDTYRSAAQPTADLST